jgi:dihydrofolate reductase
MFSLIIARSANNIIGIDNKLPWNNLSDDMYLFKLLTQGKTIVMGRKTFESLPGILPNRKHIVISRSKGEKEIGDVVYLQDISKIVPNSKQEIIIIGGSQIISLFKDKIQRIYLTTLKENINIDFAKSISYFPEDLDLGLFDEKLSLFKKKNTKNFSDFTFQILERIKI